MGSKTKKLADGAALEEQGSIQSKILTSNFVGQADIKKIDAGGNMAAPMLAEVLGGNALLGFIAAVSFATILAVVAGLTLSGAAALSHDLWVKLLCAECELKIFLLNFPYN